MSNFRFGLDGYGLNYYPSEASDGDGSVDWDKVESVEIEFVDFIRKPDDKSRWYELFGTPERAAWTLIDCNGFGDCVDCPVCHDELGKTCEIPGDCAFVMRDYDVLLDWLKGGAE